MNTYYVQWDFEELMSMHGIEYSPHDNHTEHDDYERDKCSEEVHISMDSLGLYWKDFM